MYMVFKAIKLDEISIVLSGISETKKDRWHTISLTRGI